MSERQEKVLNEVECGANFSAVSLACFRVEVAEYQRCIIFHHRGQNLDLTKSSGE